jgi:methyl acetate hydrolase
MAEAVSGQTLEQYSREKIFDPFGMADTSYDVVSEKQSRLATLHQRAADGGLTESPARPLQPVKVYRGDGGLYSTVAMMEANQIGGLSLYPFKTVIPQQSLDGAIPGGLEKFGPGFALTTKTIEGGRSAGSLAWAGLDNTYFWIDPARRTTAAIMMQILPFLDRGALDTLTKFERAVYDAEQAKGGQ